MSFVDPQPLPARRHLGILPGPTSGHQPRVWGDLFELAVQQPFRLTIQQDLSHEDAAALADRMVLRTDTVLDAFRWLRHHDLLRLQHDEAGNVARPDLDALRRLLARQQVLERAGTKHLDLAALTYFRSRLMWARAPWLESVLVRDGAEVTP